MQIAVIWLQTLDTSLYFARIQAVVPPWKKLLNVNGVVTTCRSEVCHLLPVCPVDIRDRTKFSVSEYVTSYSVIPLY